MQVTTQFDISETGCEINVSFVSEMPDVRHIREVIMLTLYGENAGIDLKSIILLI